MEDSSSPVRSAAHLSFHTSQPRKWGQGWISGTFSVALGILGLGAVLCFHFPDLFTLPPLRGQYPLPFVRTLLHCVLVGGFLLGTASLWLRHNKALGLTGIGLVLVAALLGGAQVPVGSSDSPHGIFGLDWFLLNLILYSIVYIPLERLFALHPLQPVFRSGWTTDLLYFFLNNLLVQATTLLTLTPAMILFDWAKIPALVEWIGSLQLVVQVILAILVADFTQYWVHRGFHTIPMLWRFHAVHYSAQSMDWLAGARLHIVDVLLTRALTYVPIYLLGFSQTAVVIYVVVVVIQATFIHTNVHWKFRPLRWILATPHFHHWHHSAEPEAIDKNFAVHTLGFDLLFGTYFLPGRWPKITVWQGVPPFPAAGGDNSFIPSEGTPKPDP